MILPDVNVLVYAYRKDMDDHPRFRDWIHRVVNAGQPYGMSEMVLSGFVRVVTNPRVFRRPSTPSEALSFAVVFLLRAGQARSAPLGDIRPPVPTTRRHRQSRGRRLPGRGCNGGGLRVGDGRP